jgi:hypothetical protein
MVAASVSGMQEGNNAMRRKIELVMLALQAVLIAGCGDDDSGAPAGTPIPTKTSTPTTTPTATATATSTPTHTPSAYEEPREACAARSPLRNAYFGDLHVHTANSFDAYAFDVRVTPQQAYRFAQGEAVLLPPLDEHGNGTRQVQIDRPLDFAAVTDHSEFLGEVETCVTPGAPGYDSTTCQTYRLGASPAIQPWGLQLNATNPKRFTDACGRDGAFCLARAAEVWQRMQDAANAAYDRSAACRFTSFIAYEYSGSAAVSTLHRNVIFRNDRVSFPISHYEAPTPRELWQELHQACVAADNGCQVLAIPHNSNESTGRMFDVEYPGAQSVEDQRAQADLRVAMEPLIEVYQHKGDSECSNGPAGIIGQPDELCTFEKTKTVEEFGDCGESLGSFGSAITGCLARVDYLRGILLEGMKEQQRLGVNPYRLGVIASTDTHNGTPGATSERGFIGHRGLDDGSIESLLGPGQLTRGGIIFNPGGLAGVWAEENSRPALFDALRRREVFGTSGPRMTVRLFGGWNLPANLCAAPDMIERGYQLGVPMGGTLPARGASAAPSFLVSAMRDPGTVTRPGTPLQRLQIVKGWIENGERHVTVFDVAGDANNGAGVDLGTCTPTGPGADSLCTQWTDPTFRADQHAYYYVRVLENPSCRWNQFVCNQLPPDQREPACDDPTAPKTIQERAWTSPIWYEP